MPAACWLIAPVLGLAVAHCTEFGVGASPALFEVSAAVAALTGFAVFVELAIVLGAVIDDQGITAANHRLARATIRINAGLLAISLGSSLYAVGNRTSSTLLLFLVFVPMILQLGLMVECAYHRVGASRVRGG